MFKIKVPKGKTGKTIKVKTPGGTILSVKVPRDKKAGDELNVPLPESEQIAAAPSPPPPPPTSRPQGPSMTAVAQAGLGSEWAFSAIDRNEFLEIGTFI